MEKAMLNLWKSPETIAPIAKQNEKNENPSKMALFENPKSQ